MEYCYSGTESLWYGSWNRHVCRKGKCASDRYSRPTGVNPSRKQRCSSPSCLWSQAQRDTSGQDNSNNLVYWLTISHRCICMWSGTEMLIFSFQLRAKTMNSASCEYRNMSARRGAQFVPIWMPTICLKPFPRKCCRLIMMSSSVYLFFESECSLLK